MGLLERIKTAGKLIIEGFHELKEKFASTIERFGNKCKEWGEKAANYIRSTSKPRYKPEPTDQKDLQGCKETLDEFFYGNIKETLITQCNEDRLQTFENLGRAASERMGLANPPDIVFYTPNSLKEAATYGAYSRTDNTLRLNAAMIVCDHEELLQEQVFTVFHELRHAKQWEAVTDCANGVNRHGYSNERMMEYAENFVNYIASEPSYEDYRNQPLERDAFGFEEELKGMYL